MRVLATILVSFVASLADAQQQYVPHLQKKLLVATTQCRTVACVDRVLASAPYIDPPLRLIAASKVAELDPDAAGERLSNAIPRDPVTFWFCYSVTMPELGKDFAAVRRLYDLYFPAAAAAAAKSGEHIGDFLLLAEFADGEMAAAIREDVLTIRKLNPGGYCEARRKLHADVARRLPECVARPAGRKE